MIESYMKTVHNTLIFLALQAGFSSEYQQLHTIGLSLVMLILLIWPIFVVVFLTTRSNELDDKMFKFRYESMYLGNRTDTYLEGVKKDRRVCYLYAFFFCIRRLALVFCVFYLKEENYQQCIYGLIGIQMAYIIYMSNGKPHIDDFFNSLELFNEVFLLMLFYTMLGF